MQVTIHNNDIDLIMIYSDTSITDETEVDMGLWVIDGDVCLVEPDHNPVNGTYIGIVQNVKISDYSDVLIVRIQG